MSDDRTVVGRPAEAVDTPALVVDLAAMERNVARMAAFFADRPAKLRPHFKSHKCLSIARLQMAAGGAVGLTAAKLGEAEVLVEQGGFDDVLIANQVVGRVKIERLMRLAGRARMMVAVDSASNVADLGSAAATAGVRLRVLVEVDVGMGRCGVRRIEDAVALARQVDWASHLDFAGVMGYEGHAVLVEDAAERAERARRAMAHLLAARDALVDAGLSVGIVSAGGTGTYDISGACPGVTEIQAGSYVLMDAKYAGLGLGFEPALACLATVISRPAPDLALTDAGRKSLSEDFGLAPCLDLPGATPVKSSEEHGHLRLGGADCKVGQKVFLRPTHVCTTVNLHDRLYAVRGGIVEAVWPIEGRGRAQ
jgi:D-serine deaminase-like pyridoxal phosphate-dependent protein